MWPGKTRAHRLLVAGATFAAVLIAGGWPSARVAHGFAVAYSGLANVILASITFGNGGRARLVAAETNVSRVGDAVAADTQIALTVDGRTNSARLGISLRRDAYLPLLILLATVLAGPLAWRRKLQVGAIGLGIELLITLGAVVLLVGSALALGVPGLYPPRSAALWDLASRTLLLPPGNRFIVPLGIGVALSLLTPDSRSESR